MSRHRDIRNLNVGAELDDDALSDGGEEPMTQEEEAQLSDALEQVRTVVGSVEVSGISDNDIKDHLWNNWFDAEDTVIWALEEKERRRLAKERKEPFDYDESALEYFKSRQQLLDQPEAQSRIPKIILAQQQALEQGYYVPEPETSDFRPVRDKLSTIFERSEISEPSIAMAPAYMETNLKRSARLDPDDSHTTSYGSLLEDNDFTETKLARRFAEGLPLHQPAAIPHSPQLSDNPPTNISFGTVERKSLTPQHTGVPHHINNPQHAGIPHYEKPLPIPPPSSKPSKLSLLASSRASTVSQLSESSGSDGTTVTGSIKTYPVLRPAESEVTATTSVPTRSRPQSTVSSDLNIPNSKATRSSDMSAQVQKAIEAALQLEALDRKAQSEVHQRPESMSASSSRASQVSDAQSDERKSTTSSNSPSRAQSTTSKPPSRLSQLSAQALLKTTPQQSSDTTDAKLPPASKIHTLQIPQVVNRVRPSSTPNTPASATKTENSARPKSKLALLAQQKASSKAPQLPEPKTEYLTPTANGPTATTAITTSYQSLYSLTDPNSPSVIPRLDLVPLPPNAPPTPTDSKKSKLAMKIKKANEKNTPRVPAADVEETAEIQIAPMFQESSPRSRASPSAFATVLVRDDLVVIKPKKNFKSAQKKKLDEDTIVDEVGANIKARRRKKREAPLPTVSSTLSSFAFDSPSPDDIVFNARRGTSLAHAKSTART